MRRGISASPPLTIPPDITLFSQHNAHLEERPRSARRARVSVGMGRYRLCPLATLDGGAPSVKPAPWVVAALAL